MQDAFLIGQDNRVRAVRHNKSQSLVHGDGHKLRFKCVSDCRNPARRNVRLFLAVVQPEEIQHGVEHFAHPVGRLLDVSDIHPCFIRTAIFPHQSGIAGYCRQRSA